ncbi:hypothetical protein ACKVWC_009650 [Pyricularia oryzae]
MLLLSGLSALLDYLLHVLSVGDVDDWVDQTDPVESWISRRVNAKGSFALECMWMSAHSLHPSFHVFPRLLLPRLVQTCRAAFVLAAEILISNTIKFDRLGLPAAVCVYKSAQIVH